jgi:hypothetical protein
VVDGAAAAPAPYPPEPWHLGGQLVVSAFRVPMDRLPAGFLDALPAGHRPLTARGRLAVNAAFAHYRPGGVLAYDELLVGFPVVARGALRFTIPLIWVTSELSLRGGRELWGIPKDMGAIQRADGRTAATVDDRRIAALEARLGRRLWPGSPAIRLATAQRLHGCTFVARNTVFATIRTVAAKWSFAPDGPLGFLAERQPAFSLALDDAAIVFGREVERGRR